MLYEIRPYEFDGKNMKKSQPTKKNREIIIYQSPAGNIKIYVCLEDETVWLTQKLMAELFQATVPNINMHLNIFSKP